MNKLSGAAMLAVISTGLVAVPAMADHSWGNYHWSISAAPLTLDMGDNVGAEWDSYLALASSDWSKSRVLDTTVVTGGTNNRTGAETPRTCVPTAGRIEVCAEAYGFNQWLGIATIWLSGGHITQATTKLNDSYFNTARYNTFAWRALVMCQEIGHDFGLDHQDENFSTDETRSCMDYTSLPEGNEHPDRHDLEQISAMYSHTHSNFAARTVGQTSAAPASDSGAGDSPSEWGAAIDRDAHGRADTFSKDLGGGRQRITHVFWVPPEN